MHMCITAGGTHLSIHPPFFSLSKWTNLIIATSKVWPVVHTDLNKRGLKSVSPKEVRAVNGWTSGSVIAQMQCPSPCA